MSDHYAELLDYLEFLVCTSIDVSNCLGLLTLAHNFSRKDLKDACLGFIMDNSCVVLGQKEWEELDHELMLEVSKSLYECGLPWKSMEQDSCWS